MHFLSDCLFGLRILAELDEELSFEVYFVDQLDRKRKTQQVEQK